MEYTNRFGDIPDEYASESRAKIVVIPVPYDETSTWQKGADKGPEALIDASKQMELYDIDTCTEVYKQGIYTAAPLCGFSSPKNMVHEVYSAVKRYIHNNKFVALVGGEHSVSIGSVIAHNEHFDNLSVLQLDAHTDLRNEYEGSIYNHACVMARIKEVCPIVQAGIRSMDRSEAEAVIPEKIFYAKDILQADTSWQDSVLDQLSENVYLTFDLDVLDPSIMPSTGTPEPGGLLWYDVMGLMRKLFNDKNVVGLDIVELCPATDKSPDFLAAKLLYSMLSFRFKNVSHEKTRFTEGRN